MSDNQAQTAQGAVYGRVERIHRRNKEGLLLPVGQWSAIVETNSGEIYAAYLKDLKNLFRQVQPDMILRGVPRGNRLYDVEVA